MDMSPLCISLLDMLDLALGSPEIGAINLNILHNFLHILLELNGLQSIQLEYRGEDANKIKAMLSTSLTSEQKSYTHDYSLKDIYKISKLPNKALLEKEINEKMKSTNISQPFPYKIDLTCEKSKEFKKLQDRQFLTLEQLVNETNTNCVIEETDILSKEQDVVKLSSERRKMVSNEAKREFGGGDLVKQVVNMNKRLSEVEDNINSLDKDVSQLQNQNNELEKILGNINSSNQNNANKNEYTENKCEIELQTVNQRHSLSQEADIPCSTSTFNTGPTTEQLQKEVLGEVNCSKLRADIMKADITLTQMKSEICDLREKIHDICKTIDFGENDKNKSKRFNKCTITPEGDSDNNYIVIKQKPTDLKPSRCADLIHEVEKSVMNTIQCINKRLEFFEEYVNCSIKNICDSIMKNKNEEELMKYVYAIRTDFEDMRKAVCEIINFKECQIQRNNVFQEQIEILKTIKANQEEVDFALADKASICDLNKKVSHEQFDAVVNAMNLNFEDVMTKLIQQESMWQQSIAELRIEFDGKIEDMEISAFKECISKDLESLKNHIQILNQMKREQETAGARKILRDLRCISCDKDAYMKTNSATITGKSFPCRLSMQPCISFKVNHIRQQQKYITGKKVINLEKNITENFNTNHSCPDNCEIDNRQHICNRYCGGSHTILGPQQRIPITKNQTHLNMHELKMIEGFVEGTDGRMYKGRWIRGQKN